MKKYFFPLFTIITAGQLSAQVNIGIMAGSDFSNRITRNVPDLVASVIPTKTETFCSYYIGVSSDFSLSEHFFLSPELFFARRGRKVFFDPLELTITSINNTVVLPVPVKYSILKRLQLYTGPEFSYIVSRDSKGVPLGSGAESEFERSFDIAFTAGLSVEVIKRLSLDLRFSRGLLDQSKTYYIPGDVFGPEYTGQVIAVDYDEYTWSLQVGLKYNFISRKQ